MSKKSDKKNYNLKSDAVEELLRADNGEVPQYSEEELNRYRSGGKKRIPEWLKVLFIKIWFAGAVCYFILWGLGIYIYSLIDMLFILGIVLGIVTDLLVNNVIRFIEPTPGENDKWLLVSHKGMVGFFLNMIYGLVIVTCVYLLYNVINAVIIGFTGAVDTVPLGVEPVLYGVFCTVFDLLFIGMKRLMGSIIDDAKRKAEK